MWTQSHTIVTKKATREQLWKLFANVNQWSTWDEGVEYAKMDGRFEKGNFFVLKPKGGPKVKIQLIEAIENKGFTDLTRFPLAKMYGEHIFEDTTEERKSINFPGSFTSRSVNFSVSGLNLVKPPTSLAK